MERLSRLDLLRVLAVLVVYLHHFVLVFYVSSIAGLSRLQHVVWERVLYASPIGILVNGNFAVHVFFVLSGFVLCLPFYRNLHLSITAFTYARRYLRLTVPIFVSVILAFLILEFGLIQAIPLGKATNSLPAIGELWRNTPTLGEAFLRGVGKVYILKDKDYNPVLWMMKYILFGSFILYTLTLIRSIHVRRIAVAVCIVFFSLTNFLGIFLGAVLADVYVNQPKYTQPSRWLSLAKLVLLALAILFGSFPMYGYELSKLHRLMYFTPIDFFTLSTFYHAVAAAMLVMWFLFSRSLETVSKSAIIRYLSSLSFFIYLTHMLVIAVLGSSFFMAVRPYLSYNLSVGLTFILSTLVILPLAWAGHHFIEKPLQLKLHNLRD